MISETLHPRPVTDPAEIDLTRHALIEASAGTGKTYTIENLVVRLITERTDLKIENILLVTFTEKAAGELKLRIREKLEQQIRSGRIEERQTLRRLKDALNGFDQASVFTIHGFCQNLLSELAFENNTLFENELKDDPPVYAAILKDHIRRVWPERYGNDLSELLEFCRFSTAKQGLLDKIIRLAQNFSPAAGDRLIPEPTCKTYADLRRRIEILAQRLGTLLAGPPLFSQTYAKLNFNARSRGAIVQKIIRPLEELLPASTADRSNMGELFNCMDTVSRVKSAQKKGLAALEPEKWNKGGPNLSACPNLTEVLAVARELARQLRVGQHWIVRETIIALKDSASRLKQQHGWLSFDDMLLSVHGALTASTAPLLLARIREKYKIAFVDEFQDTDPIQWRIFRRIFIDDSRPDRNHPLIIIGDPKQAIYSFRGADVHAYLEARATMAHLSGQGQANLYSLSRNWRSLPELVEGFNRIFGEPAWFASEDNADEFDICYAPALSPGKENLPLAVAADETARTNLNLLDLRSWPTSRHARKALIQFIPIEIKRLVLGTPLWLQKRDGGRRPLDFGDIAILIRSKSKVGPLETELRKAGIPFSFYKKPGLFQSEQADALSLVLAAVMAPGDSDKVKKALLTPFLDADPLFLYSHGEMPVTHPVRRLLLEWNDLAVRRQFRPLFQALMEKSGLTFRMAPQPEWDRVHTNFSQLFEHLESEAFHRNLDFRALIALLDSYRTQAIIADEGADIHQIETEERKVQIMTMHVSKGLQFPVVFIAGGLTRPSHADYHLFHQTRADVPQGGIERIFDLEAGNPEAHQKEQEDEDRRLFYVALTRAQVKLYLPYYPVATGHGHIGPLSRFVAKAVGAVFQDDGDSDGATWIEVSRNRIQASPEVADRQPVQEDTDRVVSRVGKKLCLPPAADFRSRSIRLNSFSSLNTQVTHHSPLPALGFHPNLISGKEPDEAWGGRGEPAGAIEAAPEELPAGPHVGSMLHDILEQIDYTQVRRNPAEILTIARTRGVILRYMSLYRIAEEHAEKVATMIAATLTTPVSIEGATLVLGDLRPSDRLHEAEFYFPYLWDSPLPPPEPASRIYLDCRGFVRGFIDLIFRFQGRYYIADWKSNRLTEGYGPETLQASMDQAGYHLQYRIYTLALLRWLQLVHGDGVNLQDLFGGVFYFYLRGMGKGEGQGIYYKPPEELGTLTGLLKELARIVRRAENV